MKHDNTMASGFWALRLGLGATAFLAGADKFTRAAGYDPDKPNVDAKFLDWLRTISPEMD